MAIPGRMAPSDISTVAGHAVERYGRAEIYHDQIAFVLRPSGYGIDKPVGPDLLGRIRLDLYNTADIFFRDNQNGMA